MQVVNSDSESDDDGIDKEEQMDDSEEEDHVEHCSKEEGKYV